MTNYIECLLDSARGVYIPRDFAEMIDVSQWRGIDASDLEILKQGPEHEHYWDAWCDVLDNAEARETGQTLHQDGDLFLVNGQALIDDIEKIAADAVEYESEHIDAGNNYLEAMTPDFLGDLQGWRETLANCAVECGDLSDTELNDVLHDAYFWARPEAYASGYHARQSDDETITLAQWPVQDVHVELPGEMASACSWLGIDDTSSAVINGAFAIGYAGTSWCAVIDADHLRDAIAQAIAER
jgi:hypothetical protein